VVNSQQAFSSIPEPRGKQESDPEKICQELDLKLAAERAAWKRAKSQFRIIRVFSFFFLFLLGIGAIAAFFFLSSRLAEQRSDQRPASALEER
jgi:hypothetical protein